LAGDFMAALSKSTPTAPAPPDDAEQTNKPKVDKRERQLDEALAETFPASDPIAPGDITKRAGD